MLNWCLMTSIAPMCAGIAGKKPQQMLKHMMTLLPAKERLDPGIMYCEAFMSQLPSEVRANPTNKGEVPLSKLAAETDKLFTNQGLRIAVQTNARIQLHRTRPFMSSQWAPTAPGRSPAARLQPAANGYCYYHRYSVEAHRCRQPCTFNQEN